MSLCGSAGALDFSNTCVRSSWGTLLPTIILGCFALATIPLPSTGPVGNAIEGIKNLFKPFLTLREAESLDNADGDQTVQVRQQAPLLRTATFVFLGLVESLAWLAFGSYLAILDSSDPWSITQPFLVAVIWLYTVVRPVANPSPTPQYDVVVLYFLQVISAALSLGGVLYDHAVFGTAFPPDIAMIALSLHFAISVILMGVVLLMPLALPSNRVKKEEIGLTVSPEDYTTLLGWITFGWVYGLVQRGRNATLQEGDVWILSPSMQSRMLFIKFNNVHRNTLLLKIWQANSLDIILDAVLSIFSVVLNYANPFFLKKILSEIEAHTESFAVADRSKAYLFATLMFICALLKAQMDAQHLWFGRRAGTRMRSELMAAIYDKALKRKDYSGITSEKEDAPDASAKVSKNKTKEAKDAGAPKAGADVGKIVNLMAGDANTIANITTGMYFIYSAPFEIVIASIFLYQLMGWSAFAGFVILLVGWPLNNFLASRSVRINQGTLAARDARMGVLNELIGAVKFIKFFAWEDKWIDRAMEARGKEMDWMVKSRINSVLFYTLWTTAPILVSITSFSVYVMTGNVLTVSTAFTAIALFGMIRQPLNVIPTWIVQMLRAKVSLDRISVYLKEDEVSGQISSLKKEVDLSSNGESTGLGLKNATLKWNIVEQNEESKDVKGKSADSLNGNGGSSVTDDSSTIASGDAEGADHHFELRDISVIFPEGELSLITGPTASGKTAMLMALLGEMTIVNGELILSKSPSNVDENGLMHSISYAAQTPWLRHQSIKDNILFGYPLDEERYQAVVECCALQPDLKMLEDGDDTEIGSRGVSLSGGQKARVALARAVYARTKYVLLDDPLSAVDSHTSRFLYDKLIRGPLLANRTVILVTHHVELVLPGAHYIIRMLDGRIDSQGTVKELRAQGVLDDITQEAAIEVQKEETAVAVEEPAKDPSPEGETEVALPRKLIKDEHRETGSVKWAVYKKYLKASSYWIWAFLIFLIFVSQVMTILEKVWIIIWGSAYGQESLKSQEYLYHSLAMGGRDIVMNGIHTHPGNNLHTVVVDSSTKFGIDWPSAYEHPLFYVGLYAAIGGINVLINVSSVVSQYTAALRASRILFKQLLVTVVRATFRFHDTTPQGRMLNRFGKDIETIDSSLASSLQTVNSSLASFFASVITVAFVFPLFLLPAAVFGFVYRELAVGYLNTGRDLRRMESNSRSPIFSDFGELLEGIVTVRAFSAERRFLDNLHTKIDMTTRMWYAFWMTNRWLLINFDSLGSLAVFVASLFSITKIEYGSGWAGLCITSALSFTSSVYWACRFWTNLELDLNSVERLVEYLELPQEPPAIIESNRPPAYWPSSTTDSLITVENLEVRYAPELPAVLHDVSFSLRPRERVGLLGRTGSGKSTLAMSLLRFADPTSGRILIDGIDISTIGVHDLRNRLTFIPQDATLFSGTLRDNLDPFHEHDDNECLEALTRVQMTSQSQTTSRVASRTVSEHSSPASSRAASIHDTVSIASTSATDVDAKTTVSLDTKVSAGGSNFSQGQRQLIAMARALLRRSSVIVLDEATSSIDFATDAKIQATIREEFGDSLLVTVAHRLRTVIDYDRLIVLDKGEIAEFDTPLNLIQKADGIFRNMCLKSGQFTELEASAKAKAEKDQGSSR